MEARIKVLFCSGRLLRVRARPFMFLDMVAHCAVASLESGLGTSVMRHGAEYQTIVTDVYVFITFDNISGQCK